MMMPSWWPVPWDLIIHDLAFRFKQSNKLLRIKFTQKLIVKSSVRGWMVHSREPWLQRPPSWSRTSSYAHARHWKSGQNVHWLFGSVFQFLGSEGIVWLHPAKVAEVRDSFQVFRANKDLVVRRASLDLNYPRPRFSGWLITCRTGLLWKCDSQPPAGCSGWG